MNAETIAQAALTLYLADGDNGLTTPEHPEVTSEQQAIILAMFRAWSSAMVTGIQTTAVVTVPGVQTGPSTVFGTIA